MKTTPLFLRPITRLYFGRPGALPAGEAHVGESWFPPPISAFQGMIRTRLLDDADIFQPPDRVQQQVGGPNLLPPGWQFKGPFPARTEKTLQIWLPTPAMLLEPLSGRSQPPVPARLLEETPGELLMDDGAGNGIQLSLLGAPDKANEKPAGGWLSCGNLYNMLTGGQKNWQPDEYSQALPPFVKNELHTGLAREKISGQARESMLYTLATLRFSPDGGVCGWLTADLARELSEQALHRSTVVAGKKGGLIALTKPPPPDPAWQKLAKGNHLATDNTTTDCLIWLFLLTPGHWQSPADLERILSLAAGSGLREVQLRGCLCSPVIRLGGFSLATGRPHPVVPWYGAGSSLLLRVQSNGNRPVHEVIRETWNNRCLLAEKQQRPFGYGHVLAAIYQKAPAK